MGDQGARLPERRGQEEPGGHERPHWQAAVKDQDLQEADRGGRGDRRPQPGQVQESSAGARGDRGSRQAVRVCPPKLRYNPQQDYGFEQTMPYASFYANSAPYFASTSLTPFLPLAHKKDKKRIIKLFKIILSKLLSTYQM